MTMYVVVELNGYGIENSVVAVFDSKKLAEHFVVLKSFLRYEIIELELNKE